MSVKTQTVRAWRWYVNDSPIAIAWDWLAFESPPLKRIRDWEARRRRERLTEMLALCTDSTAGRQNRAKILEMLGK